MGVTLNAPLRRNLFVTKVLTSVKKRRWLKIIFQPSSLFLALILLMLISIQFQLLLSEGTCQRVGYIRLCKRPITLLYPLRKWKDWHEV